jgi:hypothetical protein
VGRLCPSALQMQMLVGGLAEWARPADLAERGQSSAHRLGLATGNGAPIAVAGHRPWVSLLWLFSAGLTSCE